MLFTQDIRDSFKHTCNTTVSLEIMKNVMRDTYTHFALYLYRVPWRLIEKEYIMAHGERDRDRERDRGTEIEKETEGQRERERERE